MIALRRTVDPASEPVTTAEVKTSGRITTTSHDSYIADLIVKARAWIEDYLSRALITQTWEYVITDFDNEIILPRPNLQSVTSVEYFDTNGDQQTASSSLYQVDTKRVPGRIVIAPGSAWPAVGSGYIEPVTITYVAGYGAAAADVPEMIKKALISLANFWYDDEEGNPVPDGIKRALDDYVIYGVV